MTDLEIADAVARYGDLDPLDALSSRSINAKIDSSHVLCAFTLTELVGFRWHSAAIMVGFDANELFRVIDDAHPSQRLERGATGTFEIDPAYSVTTVVASRCTK